MYVCIEHHSGMAMFLTSSQNKQTPTNLPQLRCRPWRASAALARPHERLAPSPVGVGLIERLHFADACAAFGLAGRCSLHPLLGMGVSLRTAKTPQCTMQFSIVRIGTERGENIF